MLLIAFSATGQSPIEAGQLQASPRFSALARARVIAMFFRQMAVKAGSRAGYDRRAAADAEIADAAHCRRATTGDNPSLLLRLCAGRQHETALLRAPAHCLGSIRRQPRPRLGYR